MAKKKKRKTASVSQAAPKPEGPLNAPFAGLKQALKHAALHDAPESAAPAAPPAEPEEPLDEGQVFLTAMGDVQPLPAKHRDRVNAQPDPKRPLFSQAVDDDLEVMAQLADLISGTADMDLRYSDEYVWGASPGMGPELMDRLASGAFPIQDYLDLHGLGQEEALKEVERFLVEAATKGLRHVLIVHGKGSGSPGGVPVLKKALTQALSHKRLRKRVLAFCTALQGDGGTGAMYVLLRKWQGPGRW